MVFSKRITQGGKMSEWINVEKELPPFDVKVKVKVEDLSMLMMGIELFLPPGEYTSTYKKKPCIRCCDYLAHDHYHKRLHWSNNAGYHAKYWMTLPEPPKEN